jgi:hypothetical protein
MDADGIALYSILGASCLVLLGHWLADRWRR